MLGTTGLVEPWDDHLEDAMRERVSTSHDAVLTTGRIGLRYARLLYPDRDIVLVGGKIREALKAAKGEADPFGLPYSYCGISIRLSSMGQGMPLLRNLQDLLH